MILARNKIARTLMFGISLSVDVSVIKIKNALRDSFLIFIDGTFRFISIYLINF